jgi:hypothetical protein
LYTILYLTEDLEHLILCTITRKYKGDPPAVDSYVVMQILDFNCNKWSPMGCVHFSNLQSSSENKPRLPKRSQSSGAPIEFTQSVRPSVRMKQLQNRWMNFY